MNMRLSSYIRVEAGLREVDTKSLYEGDLIRVEEIEISPGEAEKFKLSFIPDHVSLIANMSAPLLCLRPSYQGFEILPEFNFAVVSPRRQISGCLSRNAGKLIVVSWPAHALDTISKWKAKVFATECSDRSFALGCDCTRQYGCANRELFQLISSVDSATEGRVFSTALSQLVNVIESPKFSRLTMVPPEASEGLRRLATEVREDPAGDWTLARAAEVATYSQFHLSRTFRAEFCIGFPEFVERTRLEVAISNLKADRPDFTKAAEQAGFSSAASLRDAIRRIFGLAASDFKRVR